MQVQRLGCARSSSAPTTSLRASCRAGDLVKLAEATQELMARVERGGPGPISATGSRSWPRPTVSVLRGAVFALALACLVLPASVPRT
ncbi:hypothetical protein [Streptomyces sp. CAI-85]|uniref:hypothetical protein n=1 Tax=Streptomyces sp. CAI-85 TaxID=1472662 RepID=UPI00158772FB|nr:hypothetical protein [Streptomyces sp. CAI-85]NUV60198.1 hypothetical protein [Streptomyces sp. CAI-85]